tara:strand:+ start:2038 stop:3039 length:1002 start_codon:yes stop_codon:yes gene_type:complete
MATPTTPEKSNIKFEKEDYTKPTLKKTEMTTADGVMSLTPGKKINTDALSTHNKNKQIMKQVNNFGKSFPMLRPDEAPHLNPMEAAKTPEVVNRAGGPQGRNVLVANQNNPQPMNKIPASSYQRDQMFNNIASSQGQMNQATATPQVQTFPPQQGMASYANPKKIDNTTASTIIKGGKKIQEDLNDAIETNANKGEENKDLAKRVIAGVATGGASEVARGLSMYDGLNLTQRQEDKLNPNLKAAIEEKEKEGTAMYYDKAPGMYGKHTKITKGNVNAARKDDKAHIDYLKRDINYDAKHGGSDKNMTADEKHISKLAGDIKYDNYKKRKYDNV